MILKKFVENVVAIKGIGKANIDIIISLLSLSSESPNGLYLYLDYNRKKEIAKDLGHTDRYLDNRLTCLIKSNILIRLSPGEYVFNSDLFGVKEIEEDSIKRIELYINYDSKTNSKKFVAHITKKDNTRSLNKGVV